MLEYDFAIAMEQRWREQEIPSGISKVLCVILKVYRKYTGFLEVEMVLPDGQICQYKVPTVKLKNIQKEVLLRKIIIVVSILYYSI